MEKASTAPNEKMQNGAPASGGASSGGAASAGAGGTIERDGNESAEAPWWEIKTSTENIVEGNNYFKKGEYQKAEIAYRKALKKDPNNPTAINNLGVILNELGKYDEAIPLLQKGISIDPKNAIAHYVLGKSLNQKDRYSEALPEAKLATELDPTDPIGYRTLGEAALGLVHANPADESDLDTAISALERATEIDDTHDLTWFRLAEAYGLKGDFQAQSDALEKAIELNPNNVTYRLHRVIPLIKLKHDEEAIAELNKVLKMDPKNNEAQMLLGQITKTKSSSPTQ